MIVKGVCKSLMRDVGFLAQRPRISVALAGLIAGAAAAGVAQAQQTADQAFFKSLETTCGQYRPPGSKIDDLCWAVFPNGPAGPGALSPNAVGINSGVGSQGSLAANSAQKLRNCRGSEKECRDERNKKGGGSSADLQFDRLGVLLAAQSGRGQRSQTTLEQGYDSKLDGVVVGVDYRFTDRLLAGVTLASTDNHANFRGSSGTLDSTTRNGTLYATYLPLDNAYVGGYFGNARMRQQGTRQATLAMPLNPPLAGTALTETAQSEGGGKQSLLGLSGGYDWNLGSATLGAFLNADRVSTRLNSYSETGANFLGLIYPAQSIVSLTSTLGLRGSYRAAFDWGAMVPEIRLAHVHEYKNDARTIDSQLLINPATVISINTDAPDRNYYMAGAGVTFEIGSRVRMFVDYERRGGHAYLTNSAVNVGLHIGF